MKDDQSTPPNKKTVQPYENIMQSRKVIIINNFLGGISWALGATIGLSLIIALLSFIASKADLIPIIGTFISQIVDFVLQHNQSLRK